MAFLSHKDRWNEAYWDAKENGRTDQQAENEAQARSDDYVDAMYAEADRLRKGEV